MALRKNLQPLFEQLNGGHVATHVRAMEDKQQPKLQEQQQEENDDTTSSSRSNFEVYLRLRPCASSTITVVNDTSITTHPPATSAAAASHRHGNLSKQYSFAQVLDSAQADAYRRTTRPLVHQVLHGTNALLLSYGVTNAGKTYTLFGQRHNKSSEHEGMVPRALRELLERKRSTDTLTLAVCELDRDAIYDLLVEPTPGSLVRRHVLELKEQHGVAVLFKWKHVVVTSVDEGLKLVSQAQAARATHDNGINSTSSRSHCILRLTLQSSASSDSTATSCHLTCVDLAGSERAKRTKNHAVRAHEAAFIHTSLVALTRCWTAMRENSARIPYRDSKLTHLLYQQPAVTTRLMVCAHGVPQDYDETQHVLAYAMASQGISASTTSTTATTQPTTNTTTIVEYDYHGRRKRVPVAANTTTQTNKDDGDKDDGTTTAPQRPVVAAANKTKSTTAVNVGCQPRSKNTNMGATLARFARALSPKKLVACKRNNGDPAATASHRPPISKKRATDDSQDKAVKKMRVVPSTTSDAPTSDALLTSSSNQQQNQQVVTLQTQLSIAQAEIQVLKQEVQSVEETVRTEVALEVDEQMTALRTNYESIIARLQAQLQSKESVVQQSAKKMRDQDKMDELVGKVEECEEEMERMYSEHQAELKRLQQQHQDDLQAKDSEISSWQKRYQEAQARLDQNYNKNDSSHVEELQAELAASRQQVAKLECSKQELVDNYEALLRDDDEQESDDDDDEPTPPKRATRTRRQTQPQEQSSSGRHPFDDVPDNRRSSSSSSGDSFQWLPPKTRTQKDPVTGAYPRPKGRKPKAAEAWDPNKGAWRLSMAES